MKIVPVLLLTLLTVSCDAGQTELRAPVNVAFKLYEDCVRSSFENIPDPIQVKDLVPLLMDADKWCVNWAAAWTPQLTNRKFFLTNEESNRFDLRRRKLLDDLNIQILTYTMRNGNGAI